MGIMGFLRERAGKIIAITIGLALFAFIATEVIRSGSSFLKGSSNDIGEVDGEKITTEEFNKRTDQNTAQFKQQYGQASMNPQMTAYIQENSWNQMVAQLILNKEIDKLGIVVGTGEIQSMISGANPDRQIVQAFTNQQTGQFDRNQLNSFLTNEQSAKASDPIKEQWKNFIDQMVEGKRAEKYLSLVRNGLYVNSLEARDDYEDKNKLVNFKYASLDYATVPDATVTISDDDYKSYYNDHINQFKNKSELRSFDYVVFDASPSKEDSTSTKEQITKLIPDFKATPNDSLFVAINADTKANLVYQKKGQLDPKLDTAMFNAQKGFIYGPYFANGAYKIAKLIDSRMSPDSVKARHILLNPGVEGGLDKAKAKADSLKKLIQSGKKTFAELASANSSDKSSAVKGGDLGTFGRGSMVPVFEDAAFNGKKGDIKIVVSQYGVHIIEIVDQKGSSKVVKVAVIDKPLAPSDKTQQLAYQKAQSFLADLTKDNFDDQVKKDKLNKKTADDVTGVAATVPGMDNAREVVRWAFNTASKGDISDKVYQSGNQYIVAKLTQVKPAGTLALDDVKKQIKPQVLNIVKAKKLTEKFNNAITGTTSIEQAAQKAGAKVTPVQNVVFANPIVPGEGQENKLIGAIFGSPLNKLSKPVEGDRAVYVYVVEGFTNPAPLNNALRQKEQIGQALLQRAEGAILEALKDKANVKDYRAKML